MLQILISYIEELGYKNFDVAMPLRDFMSSMDIIEIICILEEKHDILIPEEDTNVFGGCLDDIVEFLKKEEENNETEKDETL